MNEYNIVGLYDHNANSYNKIKDGFKKNKEVAIVHATGTGKSYNALQYAYDNKNKKIIYVVPYNSIIEHLNQLIEENPNLSEDDFKHVEFRTYQSFINMNLKELEELKVDTLILDEFHHLGAPVWGSRIQTIIDTHPNMNILGMTAYTVRDRGTAYERDMVNPEMDELFSNKVVSTYDLCDAMIDGVLPKPIYKSAYIKLDETLNSLEKKIEKYNHNSNLYIELSKLLDDCKKRVHDAPGMAEVFKKNIKKNGKYIYFCPINAEAGVNDIDTIQKEVKEWLKEMGLTEEDYVLYITTSQMGETGKKNRYAFYKDLDSDDKNVDGKLRIMFAINQYNEGSHVPNLDGVILGRATHSDIVYFEHIGRVLSVRGKTKKSIDYYESQSIDELKLVAKRRNIELKDNLKKEDIIELLVSPIIIDLANNIEFIKNLENNLKDRIKTIQQNGQGNKRIIHISNPNFDIDMINQDLYEIIKYMCDRITETWEDKYELAANFYKTNYHLNIPARFRTINGKDYDENGIKLGEWIGYQRKCFKDEKYKKENIDRYNLLNDIGMIWDNREQQWFNMYMLAKEYYVHNHLLNIPRDFKTINGYKYDENGEELGVWIHGNRQNLQNSKFLEKYPDLARRRIELLNEIGMIWNIREQQWFDMYEEAKKLNKKNLVFNEEERIKYEKLYSWLKTQRYNLQESEFLEKYPDLARRRIELLNEIGMIWDPREEHWMEMYEEAKQHSSSFGKLILNDNLKENKKLIQWIKDQRENLRNPNYIAKFPELSRRRIELLNEIGMIWDPREEHWMKMYEETKKYIQSNNGNLSFNKEKISKEQYEKIMNWLTTLKKNYKGQKGSLSDKKIKMLDDIGIEWFDAKTDNKLQKETIDDKNIGRKQIEIQSRYYSLLSKYPAESLLSKEELNSRFINQLNKK